MGMRVEVEGGTKKVGGNGEERRCGKDNGRGKEVEWEGWR